MFYQQLQQRFITLIQQHNLAQESVDINARILSNEEAIGSPSRDDYPLLKGKEFLMEARCLGQIGQAYTDAPSDLILATGSTVINGSVPHLLELANNHQKPIFFYGTSIAGTAQLMGLNHLCFEAS